MSTRECVEKLIALAEEGKFVEAIEQFYAEDASMQENSHAPRVGLPALLENERRALKNFKDLRVHQAQSFVVDGDRAAIHWVFEYTNQKDENHRLDEIAYQEWRDGKIIRERFFYGPTQPQ